MDARTLFSALRKRWRLVVACCLGLGIFMGVLSLLQSPKYDASSALYFSLSGGTSATDLNQGATYTQSQMQSFADLATMPVVLDPVARKLGDDTKKLKESVTATSTTDSVILGISATSGSARHAADVANAVAGQLVEVVGSVSDKDTKGDAAVRATVVKPAAVPEFQSSPRKKRDILLGLLAGLIVGVAAALVRQVTDTRLRTREDVEAVLPGVSVLGSVATEEAAGRISGRLARMRASRRPRRFVDLSASAGLVSEDVRRLRTNLDFVTHGIRPVIIVTSALAREGKTSICCSLAATIGELGKRVVVVDADLRRPGASRFFGVTNTAGLSDVLIGRVPFEEVRQEVRPGVDLLVAGAEPPNPSELVSSREMSGLLAELTQAYDVVLVDSPPVLPVTDAAILSRTGTGALVVVDSSRQRSNNVVEAVRQLQAAGGSVYGLVLNRVKVGRRADYAYPSSRPAQSSRATRASSQA